MDSTYIHDDGRIRLYQSQLPHTKSIASDLIRLKGSEEAFFICDLGNILKKHEEWTTALPRVRPHYAVKCNDCPQILRTLAGLGTGFDCASKAEIRKVMELGVTADRIIFANPAKMKSHIVAAADAGVATMTFDNVGEINKIKNIYPDARLVIRIRCDAEKAQCQLGMKFGVLLEEAPALLFAAKAAGMAVVGVSFHVGSGCMDPPVFARAIAGAKGLFDIGQDLGFEMNLLDIGGGFPGNEGTSITEIAKVVNNSLDRHFPEGCGVEVIAEPGRFYVASAFTLVALIHSIREVKEDNATKYMAYINDGVYGSFNCVLYDHAVVSPNLLRDYSGEEEKFECSIWGPTCDGLDLVCPKEFLPKLDIGDWLMFNDMGAYTLVSGGCFNGFPQPKVYYMASYETWNVLKEFMNHEEFVAEYVPILMKAGVGCNRDAVGWASVAVAAGPASCLNNVYETFHATLQAAAAAEEQNRQSIEDSMLSSPHKVIFQTDIHAQ